MRAFQQIDTHLAGHVLDKHIGSDNYQMGTRPFLCPLNMLMVFGCRCVDPHQLPYLPVLIASAMRAKCPPQKAGRCFAEMRAAYDALPDAMKNRLAGLTGPDGPRPGY